LEKSRKFVPYFALIEINSLKTINIMQSKGAIKFVAILLLFASLWQLSLTVVNNRQVENAEKYAEQAVAAAVLADSS
jgi:hypothetical protein